MQRPGGDEGRNRGIQREVRIVEVVQRRRPLPQMPHRRVLPGHRLCPHLDARRRAGQLDALPEQLYPRRIRCKQRTDLILAATCRVTVPGLTIKLRGRRRPVVVGDPWLLRLRREQAARVTLRLVGLKSHPQGCRMVSECDVVDDEPTPRLVNHPLARHHPELADVWWCCGDRPGRVPAHQIAAAFRGGQSLVVLVDDGLGG